MSRQDAVTNVLHGDRGERRLDRGLPDNAIAAHRREGHVPGPDGDGKVEGRDHTDRSQRMPLFEHPMPWAFAGHRQAVKLPREPHGEIADIDHFLNFAETFGANLAGFEGHEHPQVVFGLAQRISQFTDDFAPLWSRHHPPSRKSLLRASDKLVVIRPRGHSDPRQRLAIGRVERSHLAAAGMGDPLAITGAAVDFTQTKSREERRMRHGYATR